MPLQPTSTQGGTASAYVPSFNDLRRTSLVARPAAAAFRWARNAPNYETLCSTGPGGRDCEGYTIASACDHLYVSAKRARPAQEKSDRPIQFRLSVKRDDLELAYQAISGLLFSEDCPFDEWHMLGANPLMDGCSDAQLILYFDADMSGSSSRVDALAPARDFIVQLESALARSGATPALRPQEDSCPEHWQFASYREQRANASASKHGIEGDAPQSVDDFAIARGRYPSDWREFKALVLESLAGESGMAAVADRLNAPAYDEMWHSVHDQATRGRLETAMARFLLAPVSPVTEAETLGVWDPIVSESSDGMMKRVLAVAYPLVQLLAQFAPPLSSFRQHVGGYPKLEELFGPPHDDEDAHQKAHAAAKEIYTVDEINGLTDKFRANKFYSGIRSFFGPDNQAISERVESYKAKKSSKIKELLRSGGPYEVKMRESIVFQDAYRARMDEYLATSNPRRFPDHASGNSRGDQSAKRSGGQGEVLDVPPEKRLKIADETPMAAGPGSSNLGLMTAVRGAISNAFGTIDAAMGAAISALNPVVLADAAPTRAQNETGLAVSAEQGEMARISSVPLSRTEVLTAGEVDVDLAEGWRSANDTAGSWSMRQPDAPAVDMLDLRRSIVPPQDRARRDFANTTSLEATLLRLDPGDPEIQEAMQLFSEAAETVEKPGPTDLIKAAGDFLVTELEDAKFAVSNIRETVGRSPLPEEDFITANMTAVSAFNRIVQMSALKHRYELARARQAQATDVPNRNALPDIHGQRPEIARRAVEQLRKLWRTQYPDRDDLILEMFGTRAEKVFAEYKDRLEGKSLAEARAILKGSFVNVVNSQTMHSQLHALPKEVAEQAWLDSLEPLLGLLPESKLWHVQWGSDIHVAYRLAANTLRSIDSPMDPETAQAQLFAAVSAITSQALASGMSDAIMDDAIYEFGLVTGLLGQDGQSEDAAFARASAEHARRPDSERLKKIAKIQAGLADPPPSLKKLLTFFAHWNIGGDGIHVTVVDRKYSHGVVVVDKKRMDLFEALKSGESKLGEDGKYYRTVEVEVTVPNSALRVSPGTVVRFNPARVYSEYMTAVDEYYERVEEAVNAQFDLLVGSERELKAILVPKITFGDKVAKSPDNVMIALTKPRGAPDSAIVPYRLAFDGGRVAYCDPMDLPRGTEDAGSATERAIEYVRENPALFFQRIPDQMRYGDFSVDRNITGSHNELRREVLTLIGWRKKLDQAREHAKSSLLANNPAVEKLPLYGCIESIKQTLRDDRVINEQYDRSLGAVATTTQPASTESPDPGYIPGFSAEAFKTGLVCAVETAEAIQSLGVKKEAATSVYRGLRRVFRGHGLGRKPDVRRLQDLLKTNRGQYVDLINRSVTDHGKRAKLIAALDRVPYHRTLRDFNRAKQLVSVEKMTIDGSTVRANAALPSDLLEPGRDGRNYLSATGGQSGHVFLLTTDTKKRIFVLNLGTEDEPFYVPWNLRTQKPDPAKGAFRPLRSVGRERGGRNHAPVDWKDRTASRGFAREVSLGRLHAEGDQIPYYRDADGEQYFLVPQKEGNLIMPPIGRGQDLIRAPLVTAIGLAATPIVIRWDEVGTMDRKLFALVDGDLLALKVVRGKLRALPADAQVRLAWRQLQASACGIRRFRREPGPAVKQLCASGTADRHVVIQRLQEDLAAEEAKRGAQNSEKITQLRTDIEHLQLQNVNQMPVAIANQFARDINNKLRSMGWKVKHDSRNQFVMADSKNRAAFKMEAFDGAQRFSANGQDPSPGQTTRPRILVSGSFHLQDEQELLRGNAKWSDDLGANIKAISVAAPSASVRSGVTPKAPWTRASDTEIKAIHNIQAFMEEFLAYVKRIPADSVSNPEKRLRMVADLYTDRPPCISCAYAVDEYAKAMHTRMAAWNRENQESGNKIFVDFEFRLGWKRGQEANSASAASASGASSSVM